MLKRKNYSSLKFRTTICGTEFARRKKFLKRGETSKHVRRPMMSHLHDQNNIKPKDARNLADK